MTTVIQDNAMIFQSQRFQSVYPPALPRLPLGSRTTHKGRAAMSLIVFSIDSHQVAELLIDGVWTRCLGGAIYRDGEWIGAARGEWASPERYGHSPVNLTIYIFLPCCVTAWRKTPLVAT